MRHLFLPKHPNGTKHGKATVLKFLERHCIERFFGRGLQAKMIKSNVPGLLAIEEACTECRHYEGRCLIQRLLERTGKR